MYCFLDDIVRDLGRSRKMMKIKMLEKRQRAREMEKLQRTKKRNSIHRLCEIEAIGVDDGEEVIFAVIFSCIMFK